MNWLKLFSVALFLCFFSFRAEAQAAPIDKVEKDAKPKPAKAGKTILFYEQQKVATGIWAPHVIRMNSGGKAAAFNGLNWDVIFEFNSFQKCNYLAELDFSKE